MSASEDCTVKLWSPMLGRMQGVVAAKKDYLGVGSAVACALSPDGQFLAVGYTNNALTMFDLKNKSKSFHLCAGGKIPHAHVW